MVLFLLLTGFLGALRTPPHRVRPPPPAAVDDRNRERPTTSEPALRCDWLPPPRFPSPPPVSGVETKGDPRFARYIHITRPLRVATTPRSQASQPIAPEFSVPTRTHVLSNPPRPPPPPKKNQKRKKKRREKKRQKKKKKDLEIPSSPPTTPSPPRRIIGFTSFSFEKIISLPYPSSENPPADSAVDDATFIYRVVVTQHPRLPATQSGRSARQPSSQSAPTPTPHPPPARLAGTPPDRSKADCLSLPPPLPPLPSCGVVRA